jgi:glycosyltransferase involved in cell wall biosynthesis
MSTSDAKRATGPVDVKGESVPSITIITVVLNAAGTLERTINSVLKQSLADLEYVILDGASTDGSLDIIRRYDRQISYWRSEPDRGLYDAMNKGVRAAKGRWLLFLGADDELVADLREITPLLIDERTVYYGDVYMPRRRILYDGPFSAYKIMFANICQQAIFYPRAVFDSHLFDTRYKLWADHALNIAVYGDRRFRFAYINKLICLYNDYTGASSHTEDAQFKADRPTLIRAHLPFPLFLAYLLRTIASRFKRWSITLMGRR